MIGKVLSVIKNSKGIYGFIETDAGNYYYDTASLRKGTFLKVGANVQFDVIPWQGNRTKAVNVKIDTSHKEFSRLGEDEQGIIRDLLVASMGDNEYLDASLISGILHAKGFDYKQYAESLSAFLKGFYSDEFALKKNYIINDKTYPAVLVLLSAESKSISDEMLIKIKDSFMSEIAENGFVQAGKVPIILRNLGIFQYRDYATSIDEFIERFIPNTFVSKKAVFIGNKRYPKIYVLVENAGDFIEGTDKKEETIQEAMAFDDSLKASVKVGLEEIITTQGFILGSEMPSVLKKLGISNYKLLANSIEDFISKYYGDCFEMKKNVVIEDKHYSSIIALISSEYEKSVELKEEENKLEPCVVDVLASLKSLLEQGEYETLLCHEALLKYSPRDFGVAGIEILIKALAGYLGEDIERINLNEFHKLLIETEMISDLKQFKDNAELLKLGADSSIIPMSVDEYKRVFSDIHNGKKNFNLYWNAIIERFWAAQSEFAIYLTGLWLIIIKHEKCIDLYIEESSQYSRIDQVIMLLKVNQSFGRVNVTERLQRKIIGRCFDLSDIDTLVASIPYFGGTILPECSDLEAFLIEQLDIDEDKLMEWFHSGLKEQISEKITNYYWWKYSRSSINQVLFRVLASVYWEYPENYYTEIVYNPSCPVFGRKEKEQILRNEFSSLCEQTKKYKKAFPWINYLYLTLFEEEKNETAEAAWQELHEIMRNEVIEHFSDDVSSARAIALFRLDADTRTQLQDYYCESYVAGKLEEFSEPDELDDFVESCEKLGLQFITQWIINHSDTNNVLNEESYVVSLCNSREFVEAINYTQKSSLSSEKKIELLRFALSENFKAFNVSDEAFGIFKECIPVNIAEEALKTGLSFTEHDEIGALMALYYYKKDWVRVAYLLAPFKAFYLDAHRKLVEDIRISAHKYYNVDLLKFSPNHYEVIKKALRVYDIKEFDDFIEWAKNIFKIPTGSNRYAISPRTFDNIISTLISGGDKDSSWDQLVKMALRTDNNDRQDNLRFAIIASYIGRYGLEAIEKIIVSLAKFPAANKGFTEFYISLWKGLLNGKYPVNFLRLCKEMIGEAPVTFWNLFYDIAACKNHVFASENFEYNAFRSDEQDYQGFYSACLQCYNETREIVFLRIAVTLLKESDTHIDPEFDKYISFGTSNRNKAFLLSSLAVLLEQGRYKDEITDLICSVDWNGSNTEYELLKLLKWCCSDDIFDDSLTETELLRYKRDCLRCIKEYPSVDFDYAIEVKDEKYRFKLLKMILTIQYDPSMRGEAENAPTIGVMGVADTCLRDYLEFVDLLYQKQLKQDENMYNDAVFVKNRYVRIFVAQFLLEQNREEFNDDQIVALMNQNKHLNSVYSEYDSIKNMILRFWHQTNESEYNKIVFLVGLLSNQWEQFIDLANGYELTTLGTINCIEELTNYRDFNIQIINRYFESDYDVSELSHLKLCAPKAHDILQELQKIRGGSEEAFNDAKKLVSGICRLKYPGKAQKSYAYMKHALQTYPEKMKKCWDLCMLSLDATSYKKTIIINLQSEIRKRSIEVEEIKLWMPVFRFYKELEVYYYLLAARYALDRKIEDAKNAYAFISSQDILPREWAEDIRNLENYMQGNAHFFTMVNNSVLQTLAIEKDAESISFVEIIFVNDDVNISKAVGAYRAIINKETEDLVRLNSYKLLFKFVKKPEDLFEIYRQVEGKSGNDKKNRLSYNELIIEYGSLLVCLENEITMDTKMQILLEIFEVFGFLNDINKGKSRILEQMSLAEQSVLERPGVSFEKWIGKFERITDILRHPAVGCSERVISDFSKPVTECMQIMQACTSEMQKLFELSAWRDKWNMQQNSSDYEYAFIRSVDDKIKRLKSGVNLSISIVNKALEDFTIFFCVENRAEVSNTAVSLNNTCEKDAARLEVFVAKNGGKYVSYEGALFNNIVELRPGDVCGQYYRLHNSLVSNLVDGDRLTVVLNVLVDNKIICDCKVNYLYKFKDSIVGLNERLISRISKYETSVPAFSKSIKGFGRKSEIELIQQYLDEQLVVISGPSRVGKSSLVNYISNEYVSEYADKEARTIVSIGIADDRHQNDYNVNMLNDEEKVVFDNSSDLLRYLFISPMKIAFSSEARFKLKSRMRCVIAGDKLSEAVQTEIEEIISTDGNVREILAVVAQILEENNCQVWYLFDEFQQIVERWQGDTIELTEICNDIMNHQNSIKLVLCGSDDLVRLYECENDEKWRGFVQKTADNRVQIGQLSVKDFSDMMRDESIWGDVLINDPWSPEALNLLYQYTGGNAICGKLFGNELINKIRRGDFNTREKLYPSDITQVAYELLNSEVGLVKNLLVLHNTKNLEEEIPYLLFIAHELVQDKNRANVSIRRIREFFSVKTPTSIDNALKILIARGILKSNNDRQRYGFSTMFYFDFFRSQATDERISDLSVRLQEEGKAKEKNGDDEIDPLSLQFVRQYFRDATPEVQNEFLAGLAVNAKDKDALKGLIGTTQSGNIFNAETTFNQVNIQSITNTLNGIMTTSDPALLFKGIQELPRLSNYLPSLADDSGEVTVSDDSISRAMDNYVADMEESLDGLRVRAENEEECDMEISYSAILGVSDDEYEEFMEQYNLPEFFMRSLGFAYQLDGLFMKGAVGNDTDMIDFSPVTIMYCKLIESLLKEYHISIYGKCFETLDTDMRRPENREEKYKWKEIDMLPVTQQQRLTIGSFVFPLYKKWAIDKLVKVTGKETDEWVEHKKMVMAVKDIRNPSAHGNKNHRITLEQKEAITEMLFSNHGFMRLIELALG